MPDPYLQNLTRITSWRVGRDTLSYMKEMVTVRLGPELQRELDEVCAELGRTRSEVVRNAVRRQLGLMRFERTRRRITPFAEDQGYLNDEDVFRDIS